MARQGPVPHEMIQAMREYFERHPKQAEIEIMSTCKDTPAVRMGDMPDEILKGTKIGIDYEKALYKMAFEDLIDGNKKL